VRLALGQAGELLAARDAERDAAYAREASARAEAEQSNAAKDEFLAMLGHELRNPLSALKSARPCSARRACGRAVQPALARGDRAPGRAAHPPRRRHARRRPPQLRKIVLERRVIDMAEVVRHVLGSFQDAGRSLHVRIVAELAPAWVFADETRLEQIVSTCSTTPASTRRPAATCGSRPRPAGDSATLVVTDDGNGIAPELLPRIFDVFTQGERTLERAQGGLGLGLTVVRRLVSLHGGSISAESAGPGRGATLRVGLPAAAVGQREGGAPAPPAPPLPPRRIVIVEDNVDSRELMQMLLGFNGHSVSAVGDGEAGVAAILGESPEVAIVDIGLPGIDGYEVVRRVRRAAPEHPTLLVAVTGYGSPDDRQLALATGFDGFLVKPFDIEAFEQLLRDKAAAA
jgi:CheY-like chemotaxis protein